MYNIDDEVELELYFGGHRWITQGKIIKVLSGGQYEVLVDNNVIHTVHENAIYKVVDMGQGSKDDAYDRAMRVVI